MSSVFLGTGAAEGYPNPFCGCETCNRARQNRQIRLRSAFLLDEQTLIDFGPDLPAASGFYGAPLDRLRYVLITHSHEDHFAASTFGVLTMTECSAPIRFYLSPAAHGYVQSVIRARQDIRGCFGHTLQTLLSRNIIEFCPLMPYEAHAIGSCTVTPIVSNHSGYGEGELAYNYLIEKEGAQWLYATDTGLYSEENLNFLAAYAGAHGPLDTFITEGTFGSTLQSAGSGHMDLESLTVQIKALTDRGVLAPQSSIYITHINPKHDLSEAEYQRQLRARTGANVTVAYDGMRI